MESKGEAIYQKLLKLKRLSGRSADLTDRYAVGRLRCLRAAYYHFEHQEFANSAALFDSLTQTYPSEAEHWLGLGVVQSRQEDWEGACVSLTTAAILAPNDLLSRYYLGICYLRLGQDSNAVEVFESILPLARGELSDKVLDRLNDLRGTNG